MVSNSTVPGITILDSVTQFSKGAASDWNSINLPIPAKLAVIANDTGDVKVGDGINTYANLPVLFNLVNVINLVSTVTSLQQQITNISSSITSTPSPKRFIDENVVNSDGLTVSLPWSVDNLASLDVFLDGAILNTSGLALNNGTTLILPVAQNPGTPVRVVWNTIVTPAGAVSSEPSNLTIGQGVGGGGSGGNVNDGGIGGDISGLPNGDTIFVGDGAIVFLSSGNGVASTDTVFTALGATAFLPSGTGTVGSTQFQCEGPGPWQGSSVIIDTEFINLGYGNFTSAGSGVPDGDSIFESRGAADFQTSGGGVTSGDTIFTGVSAGAWA